MGSPDINDKEPDSAGVQRGLHSLLSMASGILYLGHHVD
jgi:hypothetical protein